MTSPARTPPLSAGEPGVTPLSAREVQDHVTRNAGALPRDAIDARIVADTIEGRGYIIDSQAEWGGYPRYDPTRQPFDPAQWNLDDMTPRSWEVQAR